LGNITGTTPSTKLDTRSWKLHKDISWLMNSSINQEALTYSWEPTYSMKSYDQAHAHVLATSQFYKKQLLAGHFKFELQLSHRMTHKTHFCYEETTVWSTT
jgi:hypothetical protein